MIQLNRARRVVRGGYVLPTKNATAVPSLAFGKYRGGASPTGVRHRGRGTRCSTSGLQTIGVVKSRFGHSLVGGGGAVRCKLATSSDLSPLDGGIDAVFVHDCVNLLLVPCGDARGGLGEVVLGTVSRAHLGYVRVAVDYALGLLHRSSKLNRRSSTVGRGEIDSVCSLELLGGRPRFSQGRSNLSPTRSVAEVGYCSDRGSRTGHRSADGGSEGESPSSLLQRVHRKEFRHQFGRSFVARSTECCLHIEDQVFDNLRRPLRSGARQQPHRRAASPFEQDRLARRQSGKDFRRHSFGGNSDDASGDAVDGCLVK